MRILVMGAGGVGSYFGALLARAGHAVSLVGRAAHVDAVNRHGLKLESSVHRLRADAGEHVADAAAGQELVLFCVKSGDTESAGRQIAPHLSSDAVVLSLQNGVDNAERLSSMIGRPAIPAVVYVAVELPAPGVVRHHGRGELLIGTSSRSEAVASTLTASGIPTTVSDNVAGALWHKLLINCAFNALSAIPQIAYGPLVEQPGVRELMTIVIDECLAVARAAGVTIGGDPYAAIQSIATSMPTQLSSTAQDLAAGKPSEIDHLNGFVVRKGDALGVPVPVNRTLHTVVRLMEATRRTTAPKV